MATLVFVIQVCNNVSNDEGVAPEGGSGAAPLRGDSVIIDCASVFLWSFAPLFSGMTLSSLYEYRVCAFFGTTALLFKLMLLFIGDGATCKKLYIITFLDLMISFLLYNLFKMAISLYLNGDKVNISKLPDMFEYEFTQHYSSFFDSVKSDRLFGICRYTGIKKRLSRQESAILIDCFTKCRITQIAVAAEERVFFLHLFFRIKRS